MAADTLTRLQLAKRWRLHPNTLANWATWGKGPAFTAPKSKGQGQKGQQEPRQRPVGRLDRPHGAEVRAAPSG